jgi:hypothetical protein
MLTIRDLKQLALNSIRYSTTSQETKDKLEKEVFLPQWNIWIDGILEGKYD